MPDLDEKYEQLSPLVDSVVMHLAAMNLCPYEHGAIAALVVTRLASGTLLSSMRSTSRDDDLTEEQKQRIQELLSREFGSAQEIMEAAACRFMSGGKVQ